MSSRNKRYKLRNSDRSGFTEKEISLVNDRGSLVAGEEFDTPPPSDIPLGGEGDVSGNPRTNSATSYAAVDNRSVQIVQANTGINFSLSSDSSGENNPNSSWIYIAGTTQTTTIIKNPRITAAFSGAMITIECVSNNVVIAGETTANGVILKTSFIVMDSGSILNLMFNATDNLWHETSRSHRTKSLGAF